MENKKVNQVNKVENNATPSAIGALGLFAIAFIGIPITLYLVLTGLGMGAGAAIALVALVFIIK